MKYELEEDDLVHLLKSLKWRPDEITGGPESPRLYQIWRWVSIPDTMITLTWTRKGKKGTSGWECMELLDSSKAVDTLCRVHGFTAPRLMAMAYGRYLTEADMSQKVLNHLRHRASSWTDKGRGVVVRTAGIGGQGFTATFGSVFDEDDHVARQNLEDEGGSYPTPGAALAALGEQWDSDLCVQAFFHKIGKR
jgi:hypothetical protein